MTPKTYVLDQLENTVAPAAGGAQSQLKSVIVGSPLKSVIIMNPLKSVIVVSPTA